MKKFLSLVLAGTLFVACTDYDSQFDQLSQQVEELAAANAALEAQLAGMAALNAQVAQQTAAKLAGFEAQVGQITAALTAIVGGLNDLGAGQQQIGALVQALAAQVQAVTAQIAAITANIETLAGDNDALTALLNSLEEQIAALEEQIASMAEQLQVLYDHHTGGGDHNSGGTEEVATTMDYMPAYTGTFDGTTVENDVYTWPTGAQPWAGFANENGDIYPLSFAEGGTITFMASAASDAGVKFRFERLTYPNVDPAFEIEVTTVSGATATEYTVTIPARPADQTYSSALMYITTRDVGVTITDITITVPN